MKTSESINELATALAKAQSEMKPAIKNAKNPHFRSKFCDLTSIFDSIREPLATNGLSVLQEATTISDGVAVTTRVMHVSGQWIEFGPLIVPLGKKDAHGIGSATSYAKRYSLSAALGVVSDDDDDGNAASGKSTPSAKFITQSQVADLEKLINGHTEIRDLVLANCNGNMASITVDRYPGAVQWIKKMVEEAND